MLGDSRTRKAKKDEYYVPNLVGRNYEQEIANNQEYIDNLSFNVEYVNSDEVAEGLVISQDPKEQMVKVKSVVKLEVSSGPREIEIPQISENEHRETVRDKLEKAGFTNIREVRQSSDTVAADNVIKTSPAYPDKVSKDEVITIFVSTGQRTGAGCHRAQHEGRGCGNSGKAADGFGADSGQRIHLCQQQHVYQPGSCGGSVSRRGNLRQSGNGSKTDPQFRL